MELGIFVNNKKKYDWQSRFMTDTKDIAAKLSNNLESEHTIPYISLNIYRIEKYFK
jgi:hypothetical protein